MAQLATRRRIAASLVVALAGCLGGNSGGDDSGDGGPDDGSADGDAGDPPSKGNESQSENPAVGDVEQVGDLRLTSTAFADGEEIPQRYGHDQENVNPPLRIDGVPEAAESLALIVDDPDAVDPAGEVWLHWLVWNVPPDRTEIPAGWEPESAVVGTNDFGNRRYDGPAPPDEPHTYRFKLYALDATLDRSASASKREVGSAMAGSVVTQTQLTGTFEP